MLEAEKQFRKVIGYTDLPRLAVAIERRLHLPQPNPPRPRRPRSQSLCNDHTGTAVTEVPRRPGQPPLRRSQSAAACPQALGAAPSWHATRARAVPLPPSSGLARQGQAVRSTSACAVPDRGVGCARGAWVRSRRSGSSQLRLASVSVVPLAVASWGVVRLGERRSRACRWSRGRRPSRSDSEARDRRATLPQRHPSGVGGPLTQTQLRRACRLQRPCSPLIVRGSRG